MDNFSNHGSDSNPPQQRRDAVLRKQSSSIRAKKNLHRWGSRFVAKSPPARRRRRRFNHRSFKDVIGIVKTIGNIEAVRNDLQKVEATLLNQ
ncbi:hypothetical protein Droror1_Dr00027991, partial [Drosera rotundifolia]